MVGTPLSGVVCGKGKGAKLDRVVVWHTRSLAISDRVFDQIGATWSDLSQSDDWRIDHAIPGAARTSGGCSGLPDECATGLILRALRFAPDRSPP